MSVNQPLSVASYNRLLFTLCIISGIFCGLTSTLAPSYLPVIAASFDMDHTEKISAIINASFIYGMLVGGLSLGLLSDRYGRKPGFILATLFTGIFTVLVFFTSNWIELAICRFFTGAGVAGVLLTTAVLISEVWPDQKRAIALGILSICFPAGIFVAGAITSVVSNWRWAFLTGMVPVFIAVISIYLIKETRDWLKEKNNISSKAISNVEPVLKNIITGSLIYGTMLIGLWAVFAWLPTWVQELVKNADGQKERGVSMMLFASGGLIGGFFSGWLSRRIPVKTILVICFSGCFVLSLLLFKGTNELTILTYIHMAAIALFFGISQGVLNSFIPSLFPAKVRSAATGFCFNISRIFTATVVFFVGWLVSALHGFGNALFIFSFVFLAGLLATIFLKSKTNNT